MELNPQQLAFKEAYCNPSSETFGNVRASGISAGFDDEYAEQLTSPSRGLQWVLEIVREVEMRQLAEEGLKEAMSYDVRNGGEKIDTALAGIKLKASSFTAERLMKSKYAQRNEQTGADGKDLPTPILLNVSSDDSD